MNLDTIYKLAIRFKDVIGKYIAWHDRYELKCIGGGLLLGANVGAFAGAQDKQSIGFAAVPIGAAFGGAVGAIGGWAAPILAPIGLFGVPGAVAGIYFKNTRKT